MKHVKYSRTYKETIICKNWSPIDKEERVTNSQHPTVKTLIIQEARLLL